jgi:hypothetical protein
MEKIIWNNHVRNGKVLQSQGGEEYPTFSKGEERSTGLVTTCVENRLLKRVLEGKIEGRIEVTGRRGRRRKQLLDVLNSN